MDFPPEEKREIKTNFSTGLQWTALHWPVWTATLTASVTSYSRNESPEKLLTLCLKQLKWRLKRQNLTFWICLLLSRNKMSLICFSKYSLNTKFWRLRRHKKWHFLISCGFFMLTASGLCLEQVNKTAPYCRCAV